MKGFVFSYYYDIYQAQAIREKWNMQYYKLYHSE